MTNVTVYGIIKLIMIKAVLDTNVLVSGLTRYENSVTYAIVSSVGKKWDICVTPSIYLEYKDVLNRSEIRKITKLSSNETKIALAYIADLAEQFLVYYTWRPNLKDESDNKFIECALVSNADYLITGNKRHFINSELAPYNFQIVSPREFLTEVLR